MNADAPIRVLFLCTGNACRSQMAEALLNHLGGGRFEAHSAGSRPAGFVHQLAIDAMDRMNVPMPFAESKSWDRFAGETIDAAITLCDQAAALACPVFAGAAVRAHWSLPDPAYFSGTPGQRLDFALAVARRLKAKISGLIGLDWSADRQVLALQLQRLGDI